MSEFITTEDRSTLKDLQDNPDAVIEKANALIDEQIERTAPWFKSEDEPTNDGIDREAIAVTVAKGKARREKREAEAEFGRQARSGIEQLQVQAQKECILETALAAEDADDSYPEQILADLVEELGPDDPVVAAFIRESQFVDEEEAEEFLSQIRDVQAQAAENTRIARHQQELIEDMAAQAEFEQDVATAFKTMADAYPSLAEGALQIFQAAIENEGIENLTEENAGPLIERAFQLANAEKKAAEKTGDEFKPGAPYEKNAILGEGWLNRAFAEHGMSGLDKYGNDRSGNPVYRDSDGRGILDPVEPRPDYVGALSQTPSRAARLAAGIDAIIEEEQSKAGYGGLLNDKQWEKTIEYDRKVREDR